MYIFIHMLYKYCRSLFRNFRYVRRFRAWWNIVFILHDVKKIQAKFLVFCLLFYTEKKVDFNQFSLSFHTSKKERKLKSSSGRISSTKNVIPSYFWPCKNCIWWWVSISLLLQSSTYIIIIFLHWNSDKKNIKFALFFDEWNERKKSIKINLFHSVKIHFLTGM